MLHRPWGISHTFSPHVLWSSIYIIKTAMHLCKLSVRSFFFLSLGRKLWIVLDLLTMCTLLTYIAPSLTSCRQGQVPCWDIQVFEAFQEDDAVSLEALFFCLSCCQTLVPLCPTAPIMESVRWTMTQQFVSVKSTSLDMNVKYVRSNSVPSCLVMKMILSLIVNPSFCRSVGEGTDWIDTPY